MHYWVLSFLNYGFWTESRAIWSHERWPCFTLFKQMDLIIFLLKKTQNNPYKTYWFYLLFLQDEKNQVMKTNVWLQMVSKQVVYKSILLSNHWKFSWIYQLNNMIVNDFPICQSELLFFSINLMQFTYLTAEPLYMTQSKRN